MLTQEKTFHSIVERVSSFCPGSFGITEFSGSGSPALFTERRVYPIAHMSLSIKDQGGKVLLQGVELPPGHRLLLDDHGDAPASARLAFTQGPRSVVFTSGDVSPIQGSVLIIADLGETDPTAFAISAIFEVEDDHQVSSILWDTSSELIMHWTLQSKLLEKGGTPYAQKQYHSEPDFSEYDETRDVFQCFQDT